MGREADRPVPDANGILAFSCDGRAPAALHRVELEKMCRSDGTALDLVDMHDVETVAAAGIIGPASSRGGWARADKVSMAELIFICRELWAGFMTVK